MMITKLEMTLFGPCSEYPPLTINKGDTLAFVDDSKRIKFITIIHSVTDPETNNRYVSYSVIDGVIDSAPLSQCYWLQAGFTHLAP